MQALAVQSPRIKVCGITRVTDAAAACDLGIDAIGLVFYAASPRAVSIAQAKELAKAVGPFVTVVGLFVNASREEISNVLQQVPIQLLQFHGEETAEFCKSFHRPWIKALRLKPSLDVRSSAQEYGESSAILLDSYKQGTAGGSGEVFDWARVPQKLDLPVILAGGLNAQNVVEAIRQVKPYAVDVSSGVESKPGQKDTAKMKAFVNAVRSKQ